MVRGYENEGPIAAHMIADRTWIDSNYFSCLHDITSGAKARKLRLFGISAFDGVGAMWKIFDEFSTSFTWVQQLSIEVDHSCLRVLSHRFPSLIHLGDISQISCTTLADYLNSHSDTLDAVVIMGGSPCQQLSRAGPSHQGLSGKDSILFYEFCRVSDILDRWCCAHNKPLWKVLENVVPADPSNITTMTNCLNMGPPILMEAADFLGFAGADLFGATFFSRLACKISFSRTMPFIVVCKCRQCTSAFPRWEISSLLFISPRGLLTQGRQPILRVVSLLSRGSVRSIHLMGTTAHR